MPRKQIIAIAALVCLTAPAFAGTTKITIDATAGQHPISPLIYGVAFASTADLKALNAPLNRSGGNSMTDYNWKENAQNLAQDWFFESYPETSGTPGLEADTFVQNSKNGGALPMLTIPLIGYVAHLGPNRTILPSFSVTKYGAQCAVDQYDPDAGDGLKPDCNTPITANDPYDAYVADRPAKEQEWIAHLISKWGNSSSGGVSYYLMDNEPSIWFSTHRDIHPEGPHAREYRGKVISESARIKELDPSAKIVGPEEWGWDGYLYSGYDQQYAAAHNWSSFPDQVNQQNGRAYLPWLLAQWKAAGHPVDVVSVHFYPQGGEDSDDVSTATQLLRNRSTRQLWDTHYVSESWIGTNIYLIPRLRNWVDQNYYPGTPIAITEYNWGAESSINGATTQADIYGIFGAQGLDMATRWTVPKNTTPTFKAMQMYRNYDGAGSTFGDTSISTKAPNPDNISAFGALRASDGAMTVMVINKVASAAPIQLALGHFTTAGSAKVYRLTSSNTIQSVGPLGWSGGTLTDTEPAQSITLYVLPK